MKTTSRGTLKTICLTLALIAGATGGAQANSLDNLERERAKLLTSYLDPALVVDERPRRTEPVKRRLVDLERIVLRDDSLASKPGAAVRRAFANYDLTFLIHASAEKRATVMEIWLGEVGVSTSTTMSARIGRR